MATAGVAALSFDWAAAPSGVAVRKLEEAAATEAGPCARDHLLVVAVESGVGRSRQGAREWPAEGGSVFVVAPAASHELAGLRGCAGWLVSVHPAAIGGLPGDASRPRLPLPGSPGWRVVVRATAIDRLTVPVDRRAAWTLRFAALQRELASDEPGHVHAVAALLALVLVDLDRLAFPDAAAVSGRADRVVAELTAWIEEHFCENVSLREAAFALSYAPATLARLFRRATGFSVGDWIAERRMIEARRLLIETDATVEEIAERAGYRDTAYFRRRFREVHQVSPRSWRQRYR